MDIEVKKEMNKITIPKNIHERAQLGVRNAKSYRLRNRVKRGVLTLIASSAIVSSVGIAGATNSTFNELLSYVNHDLALLLHPVEISSEDKGINMNIVSAARSNETAIIFLEISDEQQNIIDDTVELYDFSISGAAILSEELVKYDENNNTATIRILANGIDTSKIHLNISSLISGRESLDISMNAKDLLDDSDDMNIINIETDSLAGLGGPFMQDILSKDTLQVLEPSDNFDDLYLESDFVNLTNIGVIEENVHLQVNWSRSGVNTHGQLYLLGEDKQINPTVIYYDLDGKEPSGNSYTDYIFKLNDLEEKDKIITGEFISYQNHLEGNWNNTFNVPSVEEVNVDLERNIGNWKISKISVSELGVSISGEEDRPDLEEIDIRIRNKDGSISTMDSVFISDRQDGHNITFMGDSLLEPHAIHSIIINKKEIILNSN